MIKAVLFDLDGVLIITEHETFRFYQEHLRKKGIELPDSAFKHKAGKKSVDFFHAALNQEQLEQIDIHELIYLKRNLFNDRITEFVGKVEGGRDLLQSLKSKGYRLVLASQNEKRMIESALDWMKVKTFFELVLSLEDIKKKKPDPQIYLLAAERLGVKPNECLVIEDSWDGVAAAKAAGITCVGFYHDYMPKDALDKADYRITKLSELKKILQKLS